jgi:hypothetical protein
VIEGSAKGINVSAPVGVAAVAAVLLQRRVIGRAQALDDGHGPLVGHKQLDQAKVHQLDQSAGCNFEIGWLDVAMDDTAVLLM